MRCTFLMRIIALQSPTHGRGRHILVSTHNEVDQVMHKVFPRASRPINHRPTKVGGRPKTVSTHTGSTKRSDAKRLLRIVTTELPHSIRSHPTKPRRFGGNNTGPTHNDPEGVGPRGPKGGRWKLRAPSHLRKQSTHFCELPSSSMALRPARVGESKAEVVDGLEDGVRLRSRRWVRHGLGRVQRPR